MLILVATRQEFVEAPWLQTEVSSFLQLINSSRKPRGRIFCVLEGLDHNEVDPLLAAKPIFGADEVERIALNVKAALRARATPPFVGSGGSNNAETHLGSMRGNVHVRFDEKGRYIACGFMGGVRLHALASHRTELVLEAPRVTPKAAFVGEQLVLASLDALYAVTPSEPAASEIIRCSDAVTALTAPGAAGEFVFGTAAGVVGRGCLEGTVATRGIRPRAVSAISVSPGGLTAAVRFEDGTYEILDLHSLDLLSNGEMPERQGALRDCAWGSDDSLVMRWNDGTFTTLTGDGHARNWALPGSCTACVWTKDPVLGSTTLVAAVARSRSTSLYALTKSNSPGTEGWTQAEALPPEWGTIDTINSLVADPVTGAVLGVGGRTATFWDPFVGGEPKPVRTLDRPISASFNPLGGQVAVGGNDGTAVVFGGTPSVACG